MARSFTAQDLIVLPRLSADEAVVLITQTLTVAEAKAEETKGKQLPGALARSQKRLLAAHTELESATRPAALTLDTQAKRRADRALDNAWSATFDWLSGWCKLPPEKNPYLDDAKALLAMAFPEALSFTKLPYKLQWKESQDRLELIVKGQHEKTFKRLGGEAFWALLKEAHEAYGRALHITVPKPAEAPVPNRQAALLTALSALRDYATRAAAHADPDVPGSEALSEALLAPLASWESRSFGGDAQESPEVVPAGGEGSEEDG
ncbi:MAG: hypothetical protein L6Q76_24990 [Polyangiaceae bacterium]|nr:hypothetical protein [Polyangiaceae bacterium]